MIVEATPEALWDYLADYPSILQLAASAGSATLVEGESRKVGAKYHAALFWEGLAAYWDARLVQAEPPRTLRWESDSHGGTCSVTASVERVSDSSTLVTLRLSYDAADQSGLLEPFAWGVARRYFKHCACRLGKRDWASDVTPETLHP